MSWIDEACNYEFLVLLFYICFSVLRNPSNAEQPLLTLCSRRRFNNGIPHMSLKLREVNEPRVF